MNLKLSLITAAYYIIELHVGCDSVTDSDTYTVIFLLRFGS